MSDINTQAAVVATATQSSGAEDAVDSQQQIQAVAGTTAESQQDVMVPGEAEDTHDTLPVSTSTIETDDEIRKEYAVKVFTPRENTDFVFHRRENLDKSHEFILTHSEHEWLKRNEAFKTGSPVGLDITSQILALLVAQTHEFFTILDSDSEKPPVGDVGDITNLNKLKNFAGDHEHGLGQVLAFGIRAINIGSRLLQKASTATTNTVKGAMTIAYQVGGVEGVHKYRLIGDIDTELINAISLYGGDLAKEVLTVTKKKNEPKPAPAKNDSNASVKETSSAEAPRGINRTNTDQMLHRLVGYCEALVVDNREIRRQLTQVSGANVGLARELRETKNAVKDLQDTNRAILSSMNAVLDELTK